MKPWEALGSDRSPDGTLLELWRRDREYVIRAGGRDLMSSRLHNSEEELARIGCADLRSKKPRILVGGLGMGFTLRASLDLLPADAEIVCAEISSAVIAWNRGPLADLARRPLEDPRVSIAHADVTKVIDEATRGPRFDGILLDVDNGPEAMVTENNASLYDDKGLSKASKALNAHGALAVWSASAAPDLVERMEGCGLAVTVHQVSAQTQRGRRHVIFLGRKSP